MLEIYAYNAGKGDCLRIHYAETHNIFVDTGVTRFAPRFKQICEEIMYQVNKSHLDKTALG